MCSQMWSTKSTVEHKMCNLRWSAQKELMFRTSCAANIVEHKICTNIYELQICITNMKHKICSTNCPRCTTRGVLRKDPSPPPPIGILTVYLTALWQ